MANRHAHVSRGRPVRFLACWTKHSDVKGKWSFSGNVVDYLSHFTLCIKEWNKSIYKFIGTRKRQLMKYLSNIQRVLKWSSSLRLIQLETDIQKKLECVLNHEELLWKHKVKCDWLNLGD
ncbi:hypothetical protein ERO13_A10G187832v2 [Gossypium hirsutum]|nr:hypothetical protein ERO13_A10G187832v2 [Gossypium hirsutum]